MEPTQNPDQEFAVEVVQPQALEAMERAQIDMQIATAKKYPRSIVNVKKDMLSIATLDQETAEQCFYTLKRRNADGTQKLIQGPSVRLAEIAVACYGNIRSGARIIGEENGSIIAQGVCHDLERNNFVSLEVRRRITGKNGNRFGDDMINVTANAACAIAWRNAVYKIVPLSLVKPVYESAKKVAVGDAKTLAKRRDDALKKFAQMGISAEQVCTALEKPGIEAIDLADLEVMFGWFTAIKDGEVKIDDVFDPPKPKTPVKKPEQPVDNSNPDLAPAAAAKEPPKAPEPSVGETPNEKPLPDLDNPDPEILKLLEESSLSSKQLVSYLQKVHLAKPTQTDWRDLALAKRRDIVRTWANIVNAIAQEEA